LAGAETIIAVDPVAFKRDKAKTFGAHLAASSMEEARDVVGEVTRGRMANQVIMAMGVGRGDQLHQAMALAAKRGRVVVTNIHPAFELDVKLNLGDVTAMEKQIVGSLFGSANPRSDIPRLLELSERGQFDLEGLVTRSYPLEGVNDGYRDMRAGLNIRGTLVLDGAPG
ncbi:MAG TPA: zinc-binding dehydrogenase, partial [Acidimicrobiales bacterium]|nr:zinc-binding dehydrogenase [Acidimicrobiales bacterium]